MSAPTMTIESAQTYPTVTAPPHGPRPRRSGATVAYPVSTRPAMKVDPPATARPSASPAYPTATPSAPAATAVTEAQRTMALTGCAVAKAALKNGIIPAIAVEAPPASARWSGSQVPTRAAAGRNAARMAAHR